MSTDTSQWTRARFIAEKKIADKKIADALECLVRYANAAPFEACMDTLDILSKEHDS